MGRKFTLNEIKDRLNKKGFNLVNELEVVNTKTRVNVIDNEGYKYYSKLENFLNATPYIYHISNPFSIDNIKNYVLKNKINTKLLSTEYKNNKQKLKFKCNCGEEFSTSWNEFQLGRTKCKKCSGGIMRQKVSLDEAVKEFEKGGYYIIDLKEFLNAKSKISIIDKDGYKFKMSYSDMVYNNKNNCTADIFSKYNPYTLDNIKLFLRINNYTNKLISTKYINSDSKLIFICEECGEEYEVSFKHFRNAEQTKCKKCSKKQSKLEIKVEDYLSDTGIKFEKQVKFKDCVNKRELPFDFVVYNGEDISTIIECDGRQHYEAVDFFATNYENALEGLKSTQRNDFIKNEYCKNNNIKLIRIPYWEFRNGNYLEILKNNI